MILNFAVLLPFPGIVVASTEIEVEEMVGKAEVDFVPSEENREWVLLDISTFETFATFFRF